MKRVLLSLFGILLAVAGHAQQAKPSPTPFPDLTTLSGHTYKQARVFRVEPDGINYMFTGGMVKIPFTDLPEPVRKQYGYDPAKAAKFAADDARQQEASWQQGQRDAADASAHEAAKREFVAKHEARDHNEKFVAQNADSLKQTVQARITSFEKDGIMARITPVEQVAIDMGESGLHRVYQQQWQATGDESDWVFIDYKPDHLAVNGDKVILTIYPCGVYGDGSVRYPRYTTDPKKVADFLNEEQGLK